jgi:basic amino acid/polyamine antiporter, APA family
MTAPHVDHPAGFLRELGVFDAAVVVAGAIIGVGIFVNPGNVARIIHQPAAILGVWVLGGLIAMIGGFAYAELGSRLPVVGGQYAYLARAWHPAVGFLYGIALLFIINGGAIAAVAMVFASYLGRDFMPLGPAGLRITAALAILVLTAINFFGVRAGKRTNNSLMIVKLAGIAILVGLAFARQRTPVSHLIGLDLTPSPSRLSLLFAALVPILFAYGGWQNCGAVAAEIKNPARTLAAANIIGVAAVVVIYAALNMAYLRVFTPSEVAGAPALAADVARRLAGPAGGTFVAALIIVSALGFLAVIILTGPRLYYAMAADGVFFRRAARLHPKYRTPTFTLWLQAGVSVALLLTNTYDELLSYVVFADWLFFGLAVAGLFRLRKRPEGPDVFRMPGYPVTTLLFLLVAAGIVINSFIVAPRQSLVGSAILAGGACVYLATVGRGSPA